MLTSSGVDEDRVVSDGYGMDFPVAPNDSEEGRAKNRRVEVVILEPGMTASQGRRKVGMETP